jgi:hypothetical protein
LTTGIVVVVAAETVVLDAVPPEDVRPVVDVVLFVNVLFKDP